MEEAQWARYEYILEYDTVQSNPMCPQPIATAYHLLGSRLKYWLLTTVPWTISKMVSPKPRYFSATERTVGSESFSVSILQRVLGKRPAIVLVEVYVRESA